MKDSNQKYLRKIIDDFLNDINQNKIKTGEYDIILFRDDQKLRKKRDVFKIPLEYLKFRKDNGRVASDVLSYESSQGKLNETTDIGQLILKGFLERKDPEKTLELKNSIEQYGQLENAVITADGFLINGNRRKLVLEKLLKDNPDKEDYKSLRVVILPDEKGKEEPPTDYDIEEIENRYQLQQIGKAEYYNFDKAISIRRKIEIGMSLEKLLKDDPNYADVNDNKFKKAIREFNNKFLEPLNCVDRYLKYYDRVGHYNTVSEGRNDSQGRWQAFLDYYNSVYKKINNQNFMTTYKLSKKDIVQIDSIAFSIIRARTFMDVNIKLHQIMRDLIKMIKNKKSYIILLKLAHKNKFLLTESEIIDEFGNEISEKIKDVIWYNKYKDIISDILQNAYTSINLQRSFDAPIKLVNDALLKLNHENFILKNIPKENMDEFTNLIQKIKNRIIEIEKSIKKLSKL